MKRVEVLIIGAGQAGLALGYYLQQLGLSLLIIDKAEQVGDSWRQRYDSLRLFIPRGLSHLPGLAFPEDPEGYATKDETADYLLTYASYFKLPVVMKTEVVTLEKTGEEFIVTTSQGEIRAQQVVVATGPFQVASLPSFASKLDPAVYQIHTSQYRNPDQLPAGEVLVVGGGSSGAQIAVELAKTHPVYLAISHPLKIRPARLLGKSIFWWYHLLGLPKVKKESWLGHWLRKGGDHIYDSAVAGLIKSQKILVRPSVVQIQGKRVVFADQSELEPEAVIWATGYRYDFSWLKIPAALDKEGEPVHELGVTPVVGLYFIGLPWLRGKYSATLGWVGEDARYLSTKIKAYQEQSHYA